MVLLKEQFQEALSKQWISEKAKQNKKERKKHIRNVHETGFKNVRRVYCRSCERKEIYTYKYIDDKGKVRYLSSVDFLKLRDKVKEKGFSWSLENRYFGSKTAKKIGLPLRDLK